MLGHGERLAEDVDPLPGNEEPVPEAIGLVADERVVQLPPRPVVAVQRVVQAAQGVDDPGFRPVGQDLADDERAMPIQDPRAPRSAAGSPISMSINSTNTSTSRWASLSRYSESSVRTSTGITCLDLRKPATSEPDESEIAET